MTRPLLLSLLLVAFTAAPASLAQGRFSIEVGGEVDFATQDLGPSELGTGLGLEVALGYELTPQLWAYAGWGWHRFEAEGFLFGADADAEETGYTLGLLFVPALDLAPFDLFLKVGALLDHIEFEDDDGDIVGDTEHGFGWLVGGGLVLPLGNGLDVMPGVQYRSLSRDVEIDGVDMDLDLSYVAARVGLRKVF